MVQQRTVFSNFLSPSRFANPFLYQMFADGKGTFTNIGDLTTNNDDGCQYGYTSNPNGWGLYSFPKQQAKRTNLPPTRSSYRPWNTKRRNDPGICAEQHGQLPLITAQINSIVIVIVKLSFFVMFNGSWVIDTVASDSPEALLQAQVGTLLLYHVLRKLPNNETMYY